MKQLNLKVDHPKKYVRAISGIFINAKSPSGLTPREINTISLLMEHSEDGVITQLTRASVMEAMEIKAQSFYNIMAILKSKGIVEGRELNRLFTASSLKIKYAPDS